MLKKSEEILAKFRDFNQKPFYECAKDIVPSGIFNPMHGSAYGKFEDEEEVYQTMHGLAMDLANMGRSFYFGNFTTNFSNPWEVINPLIDYRRVIEHCVNRLSDLNDKYEKQNIPIRMALENYQKTLQMLDYIFTLDEITAELPNSEVKSLKEELIHFKFRTINSRKTILIWTRVLLFLLFIVGPILVIIIFWSKYYQEKWFALALFLFPLIESLSNRKRFKENMKFIWDSGFRKSVREKWKKVIENDLLP